MKKAAFYQIQDGDTGAQVAQGLQGNSFLFIAY